MAISMEISNKLKIELPNQAWSHMLLIPTTPEERKVDPSELETNLLYTASSRPAKVME